jgi:hypothetical protein
MIPENVKNLISLHVPEPTVGYCFNLWNETPFQLKITKTRQTKVGDFTCRKNSKNPRITLNHDLNPYLFLTTYIHEVAHLRVFLHYGDRVDPHGEEWKHVFQQLLQPMLLEESVFPEEILHELRRHMINPKASSFSDSMLTQVFRKYDVNKSHQMIVGDLPLGSIFKFNGKYFQKGVLKRTRVLCKEVQSRKLYLVPADAIAQDIQLSLL